MSVMAKVNFMDGIMMQDLQHNTNPLLLEIVSRVEVSGLLNENLELVRKLSFAMQLSDPDDYEGGNVQLLDEMGKSYFVPRKRGTQCSV